MSQQQSGAKECGLGANRHLKLLLVSLVFSASNVSFAQSNPNDADFFDRAEIPGDYWNSASPCIGLLDPRANEDVRKRCSRAFSLSATESPFPACIGASQSISPGSACFLPPLEPPLVPHPDSLGCYGGPVQAAPDISMVRYSGLSDVALDSCGGQIDLLNSSAACFREACALDFPGIEFPFEKRVLRCLDRFQSEDPEAPCFMPSEGELLVAGEPLVGDCLGNSQDPSCYQITGAEGPIGDCLRASHAVGGATDEELSRCRESVHPVSYERLLLQRQLGVVPQINEISEQCADGATVTRLDRSLLTPFGVLSSASQQASSLPDIPEDSWEVVAQLNRFVGEYSGRKIPWKELQEEFEKRHRLLQFSHWFSSPLERAMLQSLTHARLLRIRDVANSRIFSEMHSAQQPVLSSDDEQMLAEFLGDGISAEEFIDNIVEVFRPSFSAISAAGGRWNTALSGWEFDDFDLGSLAPSRDKDIDAALEEQMVREVFNARDYILQIGSIVYSPVRGATDQASLSGNINSGGAAFLFQPGEHQVVDVPMEAYADVDRHYQILREAYLAEIEGYRQEMDRANSFHCHLFGCTQYHQQRAGAHDRRAAQLRQIMHRRQMISAQSAAFFEESTNAMHEAAQGAAQAEQYIAAAQGATKIAATGLVIYATAGVGSMLVAVPSVAGTGAGLVAGSKAAATGVGTMLALEGVRSVTVAAYRNQRYGENFGDALTRGALNALEVGGDTRNLVFSSLLGGFSGFLRGGVYLVTGAQQVTRGERYAQLALALSATGYATHGTIQTACDVRHDLQLLEQLPEGPERDAVMDRVFDRVSGAGVDLAWSSFGVGRSFQRQAASRVLAGSRERLSLLSRSVLPGLTGTQGLPRNRQAFLRYVKSVGFRPQSSFSDVQLRAQGISREMLRDGDYVLPSNTVAGNAATVFRITADGEMDRYNFGSLSIVSGSARAAPVNLLQVNGQWMSEAKRTLIFIHEFTHSIQTGNSPWGRYTHRTFFDYAELEGLMRIDTANMNSRQLSAHKLRVALLAKKVRQSKDRFDGASLLMEIEAWQTSAGRFARSGVQRLIEKCGAAWGDINSTLHDQRFHQLPLEDRRQILRELVRPAAYALSETAPAYLEFRRAPAINAAVEWLLNQ